MNNSVNTLSNISELYEGKFIEHSEMAKLSVVAEPEKLDMPDPEQAQRAVESIVQTIFDVFRDTRMEDVAQDLAWGFVNSFHVVSKRVEAREDDAARKLKDLVQAYDPSEVYANELEDTQMLCQTLEGVREALECMRDHAGEVYRVETGRPFNTLKGSRVSSKLNASQIDARDYLASRAAKRREQFAPEGPVVVISGGMDNWHDADLVWERLDHVHKRVPNMVLVNTAQPRGVDAMSTAWAASRGVKVVAFRLDRKLGNRAGFVRNERMVALNPVEAIVCEGSGIQQNLATRLRGQSVPMHILRLSDQRQAAARA